MYPELRLLFMEEAAPLLFLNSQQLPAGPLASVTLEWVNASQPAKSTQANPQMGNDTKEGNSFIRLVLMVRPGLGWIWIAELTTTVLLE
jgi:hypothetical protein